MYVFNRFYVLPSNKGFLIGDTLPEGTLTDSQIKSLLDQGFIKEVFTKAVVVKQEVLNLAPIADDEDEEEEVLDLVEALDPERKRGKKK
jgi:hypothetical protein